MERVSRTMLPIRDLMVTRRLGHAAARVSGAGGQPGAGRAARAREKRRSPTSRDAVFRLAFGEHVHRAVGATVKAATTCPAWDATPYDVLGVGLGPANLALAVALVEHDDSPARALFVEKRSGFEWHPDMKLADSRVQTPFMKDLVTQCDPRSRFTFLNYLKEAGRLNRFINLHEFFPTRAEFEDYFRWAAGCVPALVRYGVDVETIRPLGGAGGADVLEVGIRHVADGARSVLRARNVCIALGMTPRVPAGIPRPSRRIFHSSEFLRRVGELPASRTGPCRIAVVGGGQSSAEVVCYLLRHFPGAELHVISRGFLYRSIDANCFVNDAYTEESAMAFYRLPSEAKTWLLRDLRNSNYGVADAAVIRTIYGHLYDQSVGGRQRTWLHSYARVTGAHDGEHGVVLEVADILDGRRQLVADAVVLATGYSDEGLRALLRDVQPYVQPAPDGSGFPVDINCRLLTSPDLQAGIYLQGYGEQSHGLTEGTISNLGPRARRILASIGLGAATAAIDQERVA
jgi:L-ornithine N5-monooxygenase